ncbi:hypothetical protein VNO77_04447 [Canavalia gladiata]|uniref:Uncharacterized protein n=1 Tax=Canavalia gladiata TaxID=3824 RepID=A0AAN9MX68_CANGL
MDRPRCSYWIDVVPGETSIIALPDVHLPCMPHTLLLLGQAIARDRKHWAWRYVSVIQEHTMVFGAILDDDHRISVGGSIPPFMSLSVISSLSMVIEDRLETRLQKYPIAKPGSNRLGGSVAYAKSASKEIIRPAQRWWNHS